MHDVDVRIALHRRLRSTHRRELATTRFVDELGIVGRVRVDTAVLNGAFSGYEIKSERDTLKRLPTQIDFYSKVLDYCTLVTTDRHLAHAADMLPDWWGVIAARETKDGVFLVRRRAPRLSPVLDPWHLSRMLWRSEVLHTLNELNLCSGIRSRPNSILWDRLASSVTRHRLRRIVRDALKSRSGWRADEQPPTGGVE
ncbi:MAG: sce7726 family protein [Cryobacterium sp.]|nr:sce7726 family protein [Cryobacterium sp.]